MRVEKTDSFTRRFALGDPRAHEEVRRMIRPVLHRYGIAAQDQEDVFQDVKGKFLRQISRADLGKGKKICDGKAYLRRIAKNVCVDRIRRYIEERQLLEQGDYLEQQTGRMSSPDPSDEAALAETWERLHWAISQLTERRRQVIMLKFFEGLKSKEIAEILGISPGAVRKTLFDAVRQLRRLLDSGESER